MADVHKGIYSIFARNLTFGEEEVLVDASPGGASKPTLSRDGRTLAFVRRVRDKEALVLKYVLRMLELSTQSHSCSGTCERAPSTTSGMG